MKRMFPKINFLGEKRMRELDGTIENKYGYTTPPPAFLDRKYGICIRNDLPILLLWDCTLHETVHWLINILITPVRIRSYQWKFDCFCAKYFWWYDFLFKKYV